MMTVSFSPKEIELLKHRLAVPDALCDVLCDAEDDELAKLAVGDNVDRACTQIEAKIERNSVVFVVTSATPLERWILTDVIEGSTYVACHSEEPPAVRAAAIRVAKSVVRKLRAAGLEVGDVPVY